MEIDLLGPPYRRNTIDLGHDHEGPVTATLVRRLASERGTNEQGPGEHGPGEAAVLYLHGYADYFFQTHLADFFADRGIDFYALDLRKYGRSLATHQTPNDCRDLREYYHEIDEAARIIRQVDGHRRLLLGGHSAGGLVAALWAHDRRSAAGADALFLNSPFLDVKAPRLLRHAAGGPIAALGRLAPSQRVPFRLSDVHGRCIHRDHDGVWDFDLAWKPLAGYPIRAGWLRAILTAQRRVHAGLDTAVPILAATSARSYASTRWTEAARGCDSVLDINQLARWAPSLGRHVTLVRIEGGLHDLTLSAEPARARFFAELERWLGVYFQVSSPSGRSGPAVAPRPDRSAPGAAG